MTRQRIVSVAGVAIIVVLLLGWSAHSFLAGMQLVIVNTVDGQRGPDAWILPFRLVAPDSPWRHFVVVHDVTWNSRYYQSTAAWRSKKFEPQPSVESPLINSTPALHAEWQRLRTAKSMSPVVGSRPPLNIFLEISRTQPWDGKCINDDRETVQLTYSFLGLRRILSYTRPW